MVKVSHNLFNAERQDGKQYDLPISGQLDRGSATETVDLSFDSRSGQTKHYKDLYSQLPCLTFSNKRDCVKPPPCVVDRWQVAA